MKEYLNIFSRTDIEKPSGMQTSNSLFQNEDLDTSYDDDDDDYDDDDSDQESEQQYYMEPVNSK